MRHGSNLAVMLDPSLESKAVLSLSNLRPPLEAYRNIPDCCRPTMGMGLASPSPWEQSSSPSGYMLWIQCR